ncbi:hypothetical protein, variant [Puccinia triticina 1-1 BBBD Race 1]|uniref:Uncharacterized protein n=1 Tax=Puccinia triticina (isolate 1-1 / race 1 (BBBD)) TaxID=630390 RepID=A0A180GIN5_PUCT1|nr:hypothetical protein PTTG_27697 [Puccinia triticina 1-1 BBBD Race 1]OAV92202.1 hypothetical protein, variant [Puccinia triticina 1-1 BBBD Race 1]
MCSLEGSRPSLTWLRAALACGGPRVVVACAVWTNSGQGPEQLQDSGPGPEQRKRKELNPNPARGIATSSTDEAPKRPKQTQTFSSTPASDANPDRSGSSLSDRITSPSRGEIGSSCNLSARIG